MNDVVLPASRSEETIQALLQRAVDRMPADQRQAFILFELDGLTGKEVAKIGGRSLPSTLRRRYEAQQVVQEMLSVESELAEEVSDGVGGRAPRHVAARELAPVTG